MNVFDMKKKDLLALDLFMPEEKFNGIVIVNTNHKHDELDSKIAKLFAFMKTEEFKKLTKCEKEMLLCQANIMSTYAVILGDRICYYEGKPMIYEWKVGEDNEDIS